MDQNLKNFNLSKRNGIIKTTKMTQAGQQKESKKCNQCDCLSFPAGSLGRHLKTHIGEKSNKCNQCDYASSRAGHLRQHLKTHSGENKQMKPV